MGCLILIFLYNINSCYIFDKNFIFCSDLIEIKLRQQNCSIFAKFKYQNRQFRAAYLQACLPTQSCLSWAAIFSVGKACSQIKRPTIGIITSFSTQHMLLKEKAITIPKNLSSKTLLIKNHPNLREAIKNYFLQTYAVYEKLFDLLKVDRAYYIRAEPLRHPLIFYFGHTATVYVNKLIDHGIIKARINEEYEKMFAVGVDEMDWDDLNESHYEWPTVQQTRQFRQKVKEMILNVIDSSQENRIDNWLSDMWVLLLGIEHERIHLETSAVIIRRVPLDFISPVEQFPECQYQKKDVQNIPQNSFEEVPAWRGGWERKKQDAVTYGWDNQFGVKQFDVQAFKASQMLASNGEYLQFVVEGGYQTPEWWSEQGQRWIASIKPAMPPFWQKEGEKYKLRTLYRLIDMPWDWPVEVNNLEARAFCKWKSVKLNTYIRLPTEDEYYSIRQVLKQDQPTWEYQSVGNINMEYWMSPNPVNLFKTGNFYDVVGNVWQHTITPIYPFAGFEIHPVYEDFTTPTFDERHDIIKGGSFISTGNEALYHARYAFRRHFYQFAGFRYVQSPRQLEVDLHLEVISDNTVEMNLRHHYLNVQSYVVEFAEKVREKAGVSAKNAKVLTVGCSVGRLPLELGKNFKQSIGIDYTTRYFQMSTRLREKKFLKFKDIDITLDSLDIDPERAELFQMNPENPDEKKINECDWIIIDGLSVKPNALANILRKIPKLAKRTAHVAVLNVAGVNELSKEEGRNVLAKAVDGEVVSGEEVILKASSGDQSYLPNWKNQLEFRLNYYTIFEP